MARPFIIFNDCEKRLASTTPHRIEASLMMKQRINRKNKIGESVEKYRNKARAMAFLGQKAIYYF